MGGGYLGSHGVELQAHLAGQRNAVVMVLPRCENEEAAVGTRLIVLMSWLGERVEPPRGDEDERQPLVHGTAHHHLLTL